MIKFIIYQATSRTTGRSYIGQTIQTLRARKCAHKSAAIRGSATYFHRAIRKYGFSDFFWRVRQTACYHEDTLSLEQEYIAMLDTYKNGYNSTLGGKGSLGQNHTLETRKKMSDAAKGRKHSLETRRKLSDAKKGKKRSLATRKKISEARKGFKHSEESKKKMSEAAKKRRVLERKSS